MAQQTINVGSSPNDGTGDALRTAFDKTNQNFTDLYALVDAASQGVVNTSQLSANLANYQTLAGLSANVATKTANNTSFVGTVSAANVVSNAQLSANLANYQTTAGLSANVATLTANNTSFVGTVSAANVVSNAQLSGNLANYVNTSGNYTLSGNIAFNANLIIGSSIISFNCLDRLFRAVLCFIVKIFS